MAATALALLVLGVVLAEPGSRALAAARWPARDPVGALLLWQGLGLAAGLALVGAGFVFGLSPLGRSLPDALVTLARNGWAELGLLHLAVLGLTAALAARMLGVLAVSVVRTLRNRRHHRGLLDLLAAPAPALSGARVLEHWFPIAYCLPGLRSRLVVSAGALRALQRPELDAVLAHEQAHLDERHDLVVLPFVAWRATAPFIAGMVRAQHAVAALVEMRADDVAARRTGPTQLAAAVRAVTGSAPAAALTSFAASPANRLDRLRHSPDPPPLAVRAAVRLGALALILVPTAVLLIP